MNVLRVVRGGLSATVQDLGRWGSQKFGVPVGGAMDSEAHRLANVLVGNSPELATVEVAWFGSAFEFSADTLIAITGANLQPTALGQRVPVNRPILLPANTSLRFQHPLSGCYAYLSVAGGIATEKILGSRATHLRSGLGGLSGRALSESDELPLGQPSELGQAIATVLRTSGSALNLGEIASPQRKLSAGSFTASAWWVSSDSTTPTGRAIPLHAIRGRHFEQLDDSSQRRFWEAEFVVSHESDRMGYRLDGPELVFAQSAELASAAVAPGTIQLPHGGSPIVLQADAATTGGYPNIAHVVSTDRARLAQAQPGQSIRFLEIDLGLAQKLLVAENEKLRQLRQAIALRAEYGFR